MKRAVIRTVVVALGFAVVLASCGSSADGSGSGDIFSSLRRIICMMIIVIIIITIWYC